MQGLESLNQFQNFVSSIGGLGRFEDTYIVHAAEGETVVPMEVLDRNPLLKKRLFKSMIEMGIEPGRYIVGNELNSKNPVTGQPEFFLKKVIDRVKKAAADISGYAAPIVGAMYGPAAGALVGGALGSFKRENPGDPTQGLNMALRGGLAGLAANIASGQGLTPFGGARGRYMSDLTGAKSWDPVELGRRIMKDPKQFLYDKDQGGKYFDRSRFMDKYFGEKKLSGLEQEATDIIEKGVKADGTPASFTDKIKAKDFLDKSSKGLLGNLSLGQIAGLYGLGTAGLGFLIDKTTDDEDVGEKIDPYVPHGLDYGWTTPTIDYGYNVPIVPAMGHGGVMDLQQGGESVGPGTGTSDSIPAMLSDGEFVMTAKAVRGAGGGDRREGARRMYEAMDRLEARA